VKDDSISLLARLSGHSSEETEEIHEISATITEIWTYYLLNGSIHCYRYTKLL